MAKRKLYLSNIPVEEALLRFISALEGANERRHEPRHEKIPSVEALGRITASAVYARCCSPLFNAAAMDGIAVVAAATAGASETNPVSLVRDRDFKPVDTGDPIHPPYDAVIMAEDIQETDDRTVIIREAAVGWQHIRPIGEDIVTGEMIIPGRHRIRPIDIGVLLSAGITELDVLAKPRVAIFPTGSEIIEPGQAPKEGEIIESNTRMVEALVNEAGGEGKRFATVPDDPALLENALRAALAEYDMVLVNAGSSAGTEDYTAMVLGKLGQVIVHGVAMKPGKPVILAVAEGKPVIGIPGYPVSAYLAYQTFAAPILRCFPESKTLNPLGMAALWRRFWQNVLCPRSSTGSTCESRSARLTASWSPPPLPEAQGRRCRWFVPTASASSPRTARALRPGRPPR